MWKVEQVLCQTNVYATKATFKSIYFSLGLWPSQLTAHSSGKPLMALLVTTTDPLPVPSPPLLCLMDSAFQRVKNVIIKVFDKILLWINGINALIT